MHVWRPRKKPSFSSAKQWKGVTALSSSFNPGALEAIFKI